jgi:hypothetical protein
MRQNDVFIRVSGNKQRRAHSAWPVFSTSFNALHLSAVAARARRLASASAKQRRPTHALVGFAGSPRATAL